MPGENKMSTLMRFVVPMTLLMGCPAPDEEPVEEDVVEVEDTEVEDTDLEDSDTEDSDTEVVDTDVDTDV